MISKVLSAAILVLFLAQLTFADSPINSDDMSAECQKIMAEVKELQAQHNADYKAKGKAFFNWRKYQNQLHSDSYLNTGEPLMDSVEKCKSGEGLGEDFCKGVMKQYDEISPKEKSAKEALNKAMEKSAQSRNNYNVKLKEAADMKCVMISR